MSLIWFISALSFNPPNLHKKEIRAVRAGDPRSVASFHEWVKKGYKKNEDQVPKNLALLKKMRVDGEHLESIIAMHASILEDTRLRQIEDRTRRFVLGLYARISLTILSRGTNVLNQTINTRTAKVR